MSESSGDTKKKSEWVDPDDAPEITEEWLARADRYEKGKLIRRGRPKLAQPKAQVTLRLDQDVVAGFRATGRGWQSRINAALKDHLAQGGRKAKPQARRRAR